jgi:hypothetical protein
MEDSGWYPIKTDTHISSSRPLPQIADIVEEDFNSVKLPTPVLAVPKQRTIIALMLTPSFTQPKRTADYRGG